MRQHLIRMNFVSSATAYHLYRADRTDVIAPVIRLAAEKRATQSAEGDRGKRRLRGKEMSMSVFSSTKSNSKKGHGQRGSILIYGLIALFVISAGAGIVFTYNSAITRAEKAEADNTALRQANSEFAAEVSNLKLLKARQDVLLAERRAASNAAADLERRINAQLSTVYRESAKAREWRDAPVPADVLAGVRRDGADRAPGKDGSVPPGGKPAGAPAGR